MPTPLRRNKVVPQHIGAIQAVTLANLRSPHTTSKDGAAGGEPRGRVLTGLPVPGLASCSCGGGKGAIQRSQARMAACTHRASSHSLWCCQAVPSILLTVSLHRNCLAAAFEMHISHAPHEAALNHRTCLVTCSALCCAVLVLHDSAAWLQAVVTANQQQEQQPRVPRRLPLRGLLLLLVLALWVWWTWRSTRPWACSRTVAPSRAPGHASSRRSCCDRWPSSRRTLPWCVCVCVLVK